ncbi:FkbM family methyltransferase [Chryseobacterium chendengshani]|uniref:FkbM family methyltransferase n=1 Tax=Chryseobacterium sp. LJ668 TaxID=2864040 RepID=UPI001C690479|nr:FkbM family methyltransferase [Chryseobacterium sp. LJ668]MBW8522131.1 FkbM family methyltransferase [Chryseobacterium sp. LJ668]QYK17778.1 FkbM family methyltransferase [Chryseobacterium sp. LJ668]
MRKNLYHKIKKFLPYYNEYGFKEGYKIFNKLSSSNWDNIHIYGVKHPVHLRINEKSDLDVFNQVFIEKQYDPNFYKSPKIIIDAGGNVGLFTVLMKNTFPDAEIITIEPDPDNFLMAKKNLQNYPNIKVLNKGLWSNDVRLKILDEDVAKWGIQVVEDNENGKIEAICINTIFKENNFDRIDLLKMDIEGSEKEVFSKNYEDWLPKVKMLIVELHDSMQKDSSRTFFEALNKTWPHYRLFVSGENLVVENLSFK